MLLLRHFLKGATEFMRHYLDELGSVFGPLGKNIAGSFTAAQLGMFRDQRFEQLFVGTAKVTDIDTTVSFKFARF